MIIPLPKTKPDVYTLGFNQWLHREIQTIESPLVYNTVEDRLSQLIQTSGVATTLIPGLPEANV